MGDQTSVWKIRLFQKRWKLPSETSWNYCNFHFQTFRAPIFKMYYDASLPNTHNSLVLTLTLKGVSKPLSKFLFCIHDMVKVLMGPQKCTPSRIFQTVASFGEDGVLQRFCHALSVHWSNRSHREERFCYHPVEDWTRRVGCGEETSSSFDGWKSGRCDALAKRNR